MGNFLLGIILLLAGLFVFLCARILRKRLSYDDAVDHAIKGFAAAFVLCAAIGMALLICASLFITLASALHLKGIPFVAAIPNWYGVPIVIWMVGGLLLLLGALEVVDWIKKK